jgi:hypothetical protein
MATATQESSLSAACPKGRNSRIKPTNEAAMQAIARPDIVSFQMTLEKRMTNSGEDQASIEATAIER